MKKDKNFTRSLFHWNEDFNIYMERFLKIIKKDNEILDTIPENQRKKVIKNGLLSHAIRELIKNYVDENWNDFVESFGPKK